MSNRRFRKTEEAILTAFFEGDVYVSIREMAEKAGVVPSTFYRHHSAVRRIVLDYEDYILQKYNRAMRETLGRRGVRMRQVFLRMLVFVVANKRVFGILRRGENRRVLERMIAKIEPKIVSFARLPRDTGLVFKVYTSEVVAILVDWGEKDFAAEEVDGVLEEIMYLTETARARLGHLGARSK